MPSKKHEAIKGLKSALYLKFSVVDLTLARQHSEKLVDDIMQGQNMESIGEAAMDLQDIFENFPDINNSDCGKVAVLLKNIKFTALPESLYKIACKQIVASLTEKKKFIRQDPVILASSTTGKLETIKEEEIAENTTSIPRTKPTPKQCVRFGDEQNSFKLII